MSSLALLVVAAAALLLRAVVAGADVAIVAVGRTRAQELARSGDPRAARLLALKLDPEREAGGARTLTATLLATASALVALCGVRLADDAVVALSAALITAAFALAADLFLRSLCAAKPEMWALRLARTTYWAAAMAAPLARFYRAAAGLALSRLGAVPRFSAPHPPLEDLERYLTAAAQRAPDAPEPELIRSVFAFGGKVAKEIMVPRTEVVAVPIDVPPDEIVRLLIEEGHTRMPVYKGDLDHIVGVLHGKDVLGLIANPSLIVLQDLIRPAMFTPWSKPIAALMREMQRTKSRIAMVVDEYGGFMGVVALEDIIGEIVGEMGEETHHAEPQVERLESGAALVRADMRMAEFNEVFLAQVPEGDAYETLGGFVSSLAGAIPAQGDCFYASGLELKVTRRSETRVVQLKVTRVKKA